MHPFLVLEHITENFKDYVLSKYPWTSDTDDHKTLAQLCLKPGQVFQDPVIQLDRPRKKASKLKQGEPSFFAPKLTELLQKGFPPRRDGRMLPFNEPFLHQLQAWDRISQGLSTVVSTGTGSGKSEAFIFPLLDRVYKSKSADTKNSGSRVVRAIVIYPMNALIEDQHIRFCRYAYQLGLKVGVYNGSFNELRKQNKIEEFEERVRKGIFGEHEKEASDQHVREITEWLDPQQPSTYPDILLTNYSMLQYMLLRKEEHEIFRNADIQALALDEAHLYSGTLGLEMAALIARLRVHIESINGTLKNSVPVATSATLLRGGDTQSVEQMKNFFESLFSQTFDTGWLIQDQFEESAKPDPTFWKNLRLPVESFRKAFETAQRDVTLATESLNQSFKEVPKIQNMAAQLPAILLSDVKPQSDLQLPSMGSVVTLQNAVQRYSLWRAGDLEGVTTEQLQDFEVELKALLTMASIAQRIPGDKKNPLLGVRLHSFVRSEPRLYREFKNSSSAGNLELGDILSEDDVNEYNATHEEPIFAFPSAFCRKCGNEGWIVLAENLGLGNEFELAPLIRAPQKDDNIFVLYPGDFDETETPDAWKRELYEVYLNDEKRFTAFLLAERRANKGAAKVKNKEKNKTDDLFFSNERATSSDDSSNQRLQFVRYSRTGKTENKVEEKPDYSHCPKCLSTHDEQMRVSRGSPASDLSVHTRNLLAAAEDDDERRLLMFCDNRQDTSFLAGFMTDRHKRFRLRRAIYQALKGVTPEQGRQLKLDISDSPDKNEYPFATLVLAQLKIGLDDHSSDDKVMARTLRQSLTSDLFYFKRGERDHMDERMLQFFEATEPSSQFQSLKTAEYDKTYDLQEQDGRLAIRLLNEAIRRDLSLSSYHEGALGTLGMACLWTDTLDKLKDPEEKYLAWFIYQKLLEAGKWTGVPKMLEPKDKFQIAYEKKGELASLLFSKTSDLSAFFRKNCTSLAERTKTADDFVGLLGHWHELGIFYISKDDVLIESRHLRVCSDITIYQSKLKKTSFAVPSFFKLDGLESSRKNEDVFEFKCKGSEAIPEAWRKLYSEKSETDNFVRAHEHNAMIDSSLATKIISTFGEKDLKKRTINAVVATPTLEMGIDLPDLPTVIHRSVPPDPSNYAQRSGRAGRDKKRALLLAHCGRGAHDSAYFQEPEAMVAGEIPPPGCPRANITILRRHVNALCLQVFAEQGMIINNWDSYLDRSKWFEWLKNVVGAEPIERAPEKFVPFDWKNVLQNQKSELIERVRHLFENFKHGLWQENTLLEFSPSDLESALLDVIEGNLFSKSFQRAIDDYSELLEIRKRNYESTKHEDRRRYAILADLKSLLGGFGNDRKSTAISPISWLQTKSILPNFDFPSDVATFTGYMRGRRNRTEIAVRFSRSLNQSMREFAPQQNLYAAGNIFQITRYEVERSSSLRQDQSFGVCEKGCTELTPLNESSQNCRVCGSPLVGQTEHKTKLPDILRLIRAEGSAIENIGDSKTEKDQPFLTREALVVGGAEGERISSTRRELGTTVVRRFQNNTNYMAVAAKKSNNLLDLMTVVGARRRDPQGQLARNLQPLYASSDSADQFNVSYYREDPENKKNRETHEPCIHPFLLGSRMSVEALHFKLDFSTMGTPAGGDILESQYETFQAVLMKAIKRELFLGPRSQTLDAFTDVAINRSGDNESKEIRGIYFFDAIPGGSGVMALVRQNWKQICTRAHSIVYSSTCCHKACKRCIASFENQGRFRLLDKSKLKVEGENQSVFTLIDGLFDEASADWQREQSAPQDLVGHLEEDQKASEQAFRRFMSESLPNVTFVEQVDIRDPANKRLITTPDSVLKSEGEEIAVFVDGYKDHGGVEKFVGDIHKRNFVTANTHYGYRVIPAIWVLGPKERNQWSYVRESILNGLAIGTGAEIPEIGRSTFGVDENAYDVPEAFSQYQWLFDSAPKAVKSRITGLPDSIRALAYHPERRILVIETDVHHHINADDGKIEKDAWHKFWKAMNDLQMRYRRVFVLMRSDQSS